MFVRTIEHRPKFLVAEHRRYQQYPARAGFARLEYLYGFDQEILAHDGRAGNCGYDFFKMIQRTRKTARFGQHGNRGSASP